MPIVRLSVPDLHGPSPDTPERTPGTARRTSHLDVVRTGTGLTGEVFISGRARDLTTPRDDSPPAVEEVELGLSAGGPATAVGGISARPGEPALAHLVGASLMAGFRRATERALPGHRERTTLLYRLLDDAPLAFLVSGHAMTLQDEPIPMGGTAVSRQADVCAGWQVGGALLGVIEEGGRLPHSLGPPAPDLGLANDADAWHELGPLRPLMTRRRRRLDVIPGHPVVLDAHFRDSYVDLEGIERSLHEYTLRAEVDPDDHTVLRAQAVPRALPWTECPQAVDSVSRLVGISLEDLPDLVRKEFVGVTTCTHLNDTMRSLVDAPSLLLGLAG